MTLSREQALDCFASDDLIGIGMEADAVRRSLHPEGVVSYAIDGVVDARDPSAIFAQIEQILEVGGTGVVLQSRGGLTLAQAEELLASLKSRFPSLALKAFSAEEIAAIASEASLPADEVLTRLREAGMDALNGARGALPGEQYLAIHRAAHRLGIPSSAEMIFGAAESLEQSVGFLEALRALQQETSGFLSFTLTSARSATGRDLDDPTAVEYLKTLAICRMVLDNIPHIQTNWEQQGLKVLQMGLRFGGNDAGSVLGATGHASEEEVRRVIRDAGFKPAQRDTLYRALLLN
jgi:cyclic dehypoxanthinyl futalosine synthase